MAINKCSCASTFQDKQYGPQMRVHNPLKKGGGRCTVCGREGGGGTAAPAAKAVKTAKPAK